MKIYPKVLSQLSFALLIFLGLGSLFTLADSRPQVRFFHAAPGISNIDIYINDLLYFENVFYSHMSDYAPSNPGDQTVRVRTAGSSHKDPALVEVSSPYNDNQGYTLIIAGRQGDIHRWRLDDDNKNLPGNGTSKVRIVHAAFDTPTTEICLVDVCRTLAFREDTGYFRMDPGLYYPEIYLNGTDFPKINIPPLTLKDNSIHTVFMIGRSQNEPRLQLIYTFDAGEPLPDIEPPLPPGTQPPSYPPVTGAFLSPKLMGMIAGLVLIVVGGVGYWFTRKAGKAPGL